MFSVVERALARTRKKRATASIRKVERARGRSGPGCDTPGDLVNGLYRIVEMMQIFAIVSDTGLADEVQRIATQFQEEDETSDYYLKVRNGFGRLFELGHLLTTRLEQTL